MDWWLILVACIVGVVLLAVNIYILVIYQSEDDRGMNGSLFAKAIVLMGLTLAWGLVLLLPLDVANSKSTGGATDSQMEWTWKVIYIIAAAFVFVLTPLATIYYEADEDRSKADRFMSAIVKTIFVDAILGGVITAGYFYLNKTTAKDPKTQQSFATFKYSVDYLTYLIAACTFIGWWFFILFGGIGLAAIPMDMFRAYKRRPTRTNLAQYSMKRREIGVRAQHLLFAGKTLDEERKALQHMSGGFSKMRAQISYNARSNRFKKLVLQLDQEHMQLNEGFSDPTGRRLVAHLQLALGFVTMLVSLAWVLHVLLYMVISVHGKPVTPFLNELLTRIEIRNFSFFSTIAFCLLAAYLMWATLKGAIKFSGRFLIVSVHPLRKGDTSMSSFLFNVALLLLTSSAILQFVTLAFDRWAGLSTAHFVFGDQIRNLSFIKFFWTHKIWPIALLGFAGLTFLYLLIKPNPKPEIDLTLANVAHIQGLTKVGREVIPEVVG